MEDGHSEMGVPDPQLAQPLLEDSSRADNEARLEHAAVVQPCQEDSQLDGLPQPHLVPNNAARPLHVQLPEPFDPCDPA